MISAYFSIKVFLYFRCKTEGGEVIIDGIRFLIQAKRYKDAIRPEHVWDFAQLCATRRQRALFIHTGRTGGMSRAVVDGATGIQIVSGQKLLALLTGAPFLPDLCEPRRPRETIAFRRTSS